MLSFLRIAIHLRTHSPTMRSALITCLLFLLPFSQAFAKSPADKYAVSVQPDAAMRATVSHNVDSMLYNNNILQAHTTAKSFDIPHLMNDKTIDFYLLLLLCILLGIVRYTDPRYFTNLFRVFTTPGQSTASREQLEVSAVSNSLMNLFFVIVAGAFLFYFVNSSSAQLKLGSFRPYFISILIGGVGVVYIVKYMVLQFSGWAFKIQHITEYYIFNVFLMNKIMAILLLPLVMILAFADIALRSPALIISSVIVVSLFFYRYLRSWRAFGSFFQYSRFHFFTYLCASEILPFAVLMKLLVDGFMF